MLPISLSDYWDAYWGNDAPYYIQARLRDSQDILMEERIWGEPSEGFEVVQNQTVIQERYLYRRLRQYQAFAPKYCNYFVHMSLLVKNETQITIQETQYGDDCPYAENVINYAQWDILTPDPRSNQVIHRNIFQIHWLKKPLVWRVLNRILDDGFREATEGLPQYFMENTVNYLNGPPYPGAVYLDRTILWPS